MLLRGVVEGGKRLVRHAHVHLGRSVHGVVRFGKRRQGVRVLLTHHREASTADQCKDDQSDQPVHQATAALLHHRLRLRGVLGECIVPVSDTVTVRVDGFVGIEFESILCIVHPVTVGVLL